MKVWVGPLGQRTSTLSMSASLADAEVQVQIALGEVAAAAANLLELLLRAGGDADARVEGKSIFGAAFEGEAYPVICGVGFGFEDHGATD